MAIPYKKGAVALVLALGLGGPAAFAQSQSEGSSGSSRSKPEQGQQGAQGQQGQQGQQAQQGQQGQQGQQEQGQQPVYPPAQGGNVGVGTPQHWIADAALFIGNASNTANVLALEHTIDASAPQVVGNQAQFLVTATNRALASLLALQQSAQSNKPNTVNEIRSAVGHLVAAQAQAAQVADAANSGVRGPAFDTTVRSTQDHLTAAGRALMPIGRAYGATQLAMAGSCPMRAFGAGIGGQRGGAAKPTKPEAPKPETPKSEPTKPEGATPPSAPGGEPKQGE